MVWPAHPDNAPGGHRYVAEAIRRIPNTIHHNIILHRREWDCGNYHFEHGSRYAIDWHWLQEFSWWIANWFPKVSLLWQRIRKTPAARKERGETEKYNDIIGIVWRNAFRDAKRRSKVVVIGHSHYAFLGLGFGNRPIFVDGGDVKGDRQYVRIDTDIGTVELRSI